MTSEEQVAHYEIRRLLGSGGQGKVYLAYDTELRREVALKILLGFPDAEINETYTHFRREAELAARLNHPGICQVYCCGADNGQLYIVMQYVEGCSLAVLIQRSREKRDALGRQIVVDLATPRAKAGAPSFRTATASTADPPTRSELDHVLHLFEKVAKALDIAHEQGVIHRDIKPGNILVKAEGEPVIVDFGLACEVRDGSAGYRSPGFFGTPHYAPPEQFLGWRIRLDPRTDIYSLGATIYEALTLRVPFDDKEHSALMRAIQRKEPIDVRKLNPTIPADLAVVVRKAMAKDAADRYQTAADLAEDLRRVRMHEPIIAKPAGPWLRLWRWSERNPALAASVVGLFLVLTAGLASSLHFLRSSEEALADYDRLGALATLQRLTQEADALWPAEHSKQDAMRAWIKEASKLVARLPDLESSLERLRAAPNLAPWTDADRADNRTRELTPRGDSSPTAESASRPSIREPATEDSVVADALHKRRTWRFTGKTSETDQFKHDSLARIVTELRAFADPDPKKGVLASVQERLAFATTVQEVTIEKYKAKWQAAISAIAAEPKYHGLQIKEQLGLIPINPDPESGLWEFAHLQTTAPGVDPIPKRDARKRLIITADTGLIFVLLPGETFRMGAQWIGPDNTFIPTDSPNYDEYAESNESPILSVTLKPYFMSKYEITVAQWTRLTGSNPSVSLGSLQDMLKGVPQACRPVQSVTWRECDLWLRRLQLCLPTEAQWEYAARAGTSGPWYCERDELSSRANLIDGVARDPFWSVLAAYSHQDGYQLDAPVGSFVANQFGLHDMIGNVAEWCQDCFHEYSVAPRPIDGLRDFGTSRFHVFRGGSFFTVAQFARCSSRAAWIDNGGNPEIGVRPARRLDP